MKKLLIPLILFIVVVLEGVALNLLPSNIVLGDTYIIPHWALAVLLFSVLFYDKENTYYSVLYAAIFGLLIDIVYTSVLGVYMFSYTLVIFLMHSVRGRFHGNFYVTMLLGVFSIALGDLIIHFIYLTAGLTEIAWSGYLLQRMLPTVLLNLIFLIVLYPLLASRFERWQYEQLASHRSF
ncbi:rod shape-determining protein MreD [Aciduricibacillus chroicocephali]|uniref:Rod shape-determining protein MreD n=1 Tax=Aciduricibacillus chroicocephali TaxID=3054939 RepID=A0ABY9KRZ9_9BACI|nr:rod shape-determining protein MreD [Bacillaceae bacterium 44XB]